MAVRALSEDLLIQDHRLVGDEARLRVTLITRHVRVPSLQWKMCPRIMIKNRRDPALRVVTIRTTSLPGFRKLTQVGIFMTILTNL